MKQKKHITFIFILLIFCAALFPVGSNSAQDRNQNFVELEKIARMEGFVRILIKIDVPGIDQLTEESNRYGTGCNDAADIQAAAAADLNLENAISYAADRILCELNGKPHEVNHTFSTLPYLALNVSPEALEKIKNLPDVLVIVEDRPLPLPVVRKHSPKENIALPQLYDSAKLVGAEEAWSLGYTGDGWYVAILDSGILTSHEFFTGKNIVEQCYSLLQDCPNGQSSMSGPGSAAHILDGESHGTHVAGIAAGNNKGDLYGVAKDADIIAVQVFSYIAAWDNIGSYNSDQIKGLEFVYSKRNQYKIAAVNLSLGGGEYSSPCDSVYHLEKVAIDNLKAVKIATAIASGNSGFCGATDAPGCISTAITVSGTDKEDRHGSWFNWHATMVDLMAPGLGIYSAVTGSTHSYSSYSGTSMSTPHVTGAFAIMRQFDPNLSFDKTLKTLKDEGKPITSLCASSPKTPRLDVGAAIKSLLTIAPPLNFAGKQQINQSLTQTEYLNVLTWQANPLNNQNNQDIVNYRIYTVDASNQLTFLTEVDAATFSYQHRMITESTDYKYAIRSINDKGEDSTPAYTTVEAH